jgi:hypothetical protein
MPLSKCRVITVIKPQLLMIHGLKITVQWVPLRLLAALSNKSNI